MGDGEWRTVAVVNGARAHARLTKQTLLFQSSNLPLLSDQPPGFLGFIGRLWTRTARNMLIIADYLIAEIAASVRVLRLETNISHAQVNLLGTVRSLNR